MLSRQDATERSPLGGCESWGRLLQPTFLRTESGKRMEALLNLLSLNSYVVLKKFKMESFFSLENHQKGEQDVLHRPKGWLLSESYRHGFLTIPSHNLDWEGISVQGALFHPFHGCEGLAWVYFSGVRVGS